MVRTGVSKGNPSLGSSSRSPTWNYWDGLLGRGWYVGGVKGLTNRGGPSGSPMLMTVHSSLQNAEPGEIVSAGVR